MDKDNEQIKYREKANDFTTFGDNSGEQELANKFSVNLFTACEYLHRSELKQRLLGPFLAFVIPTDLEG